MELNMVYAVSERPAVGLSGPMADPEVLFDTLILSNPDWPCILPVGSYYCTHRT